MELPTPEQLKAIRESDESVGDDESLRWFAPAYTQRRQLLKLVDAHEEAKADHQKLVRELDVLLNGEDGAAPQASLCDIVAQMKHMKAVQDGMRRGGE